MALYLVSTDKGLALVQTNEEVFAKCDVMDTVHIDEPSELRVTEINLDDLANGVMILRSFADGSPQI